MGSLAPELGAYLLCNAWQLTHHARPFRQGMSSPAHKSPLCSLEWWGSRNREKWMNDLKLDWFTHKKYVTWMSPSPHLNTSSSHFLWAPCSKQKRVNTGGSITLCHSERFAGDEPGKIALTVFICGLDLIPRNIIALYILEGVALSQACLMQWIVPRGEGIFEWGQRVISIVYFSMILLFQAGLHLSSFCRSSPN